MLPMTKSCRIAERVCRKRARIGSSRLSSRLSLVAMRTSSDGSGAWPTSRRVTAMISSSRRAEGRRFLAYGGQGITSSLPLEQRRSQGRLDLL
jgi:hypothetical protein